MMSRITTAAAAGALLALPAGATPPPGGQTIVVRTSPGNPPNQVDGLFGTSAIDCMEPHSIIWLSLPPQANANAVLNGLQSAGIVDWAELGVPMLASQGSTGSFFVSAVGSIYPVQPACGEIGLCSGFGFAASEAPSSPALVAVLDTGIDASHPALIGRVLSDTGYDFFEMDADFADVGNGIDDDGDGVVDEMVGHGTHLAGLIALVAPSAQIIPVRVLGSDGIGNSFRIAQGIDYAVQQGAQVINISSDVYSEMQVIAHAVEAARAAGVLVVASAGNAGSEAPLPYPAAHPDVLAVTGVDRSGVRAGFSNYGPWVDISAPAFGLVSALPGESWGASDGTSFSAALVSGAAARVLSEAPDMHVDNLAALLRDSAGDVDSMNPAYQGQLGAGRLNVAAALQLATAPPAPPQPPPPLPGDVDRDGTVGITDLLSVLAQWGTCTNALTCTSDLDGDSTVGTMDLLEVIVNWE